ncbi:MAG: hypothetical protein AB1626_00925 [Candidatus Micrarchaeota archaeon]
MIDWVLSFNPKKGPFAVDGWILVWPKEFFEKLTEEEKKAVRLHEVGHSKAPLKVALSPHLLLGRLISLFHVYVLIKRFRLYLNSQLRNKLRNADTECEAFADAYAIKNGVSTKTIKRALEKLQLDQKDLDFRLLALNRAKQIIANHEYASHLTH